MWLGARVLASVSIWACIGGCALIYSGHSIEENAIQSIQPGITTEEALLRLLGSPDTIVRKHAEGITVYQYKSVRLWSVGIPFPISIGRVTQTGRVLNVMVKSGKVVNYEDNEMKERFFSREKIQ
ncbi:MAG TPA: hypothetical protein VJV04_05075 [Nitrospiraceae bacterium]|nr:hypothetical protein [Nitrospiraceae bacterium]